MSRLKATPPGIKPPGKAKLLIFGPSGVGKTWFGLSFPNVYYIDTEGGADLAHYQERLKSAGGAYLGPDNGSLDFSTLIEQVQALATEKHGYKTLIVDSITKLYQTCIANTQEQMEADGKKDEFAASKKPAVKWLRRLVAWITRLDMNVIFIAHETSEWGKDDKTGQRTEIGKMADVWDKLIYELDLSIKCAKRGPQRVAVVGKSRLLGFPEGETFKLEYGEFSTRYGKDFIEAEVKPIVLATSEQVAEINRLLLLVRIPDDEIAKMLTKAGADTWAELNTDQAEKTLTWLNKKITN